MAMHLCTTTTAYREVVVPGELLALLDGLDGEEREVVGPVHLKVMNMGNISYAWEVCLGSNGSFASSNTT